MSEFKIGDKIRHKTWDKDRWIEIKFFDRNGLACGLTHDGFSDGVFCAAGPEHFELWQEPKRKVWLWADPEEGDITFALSHEPRNSFTVKLLWSETELP